MVTEQINHDPAHTFMNTGTAISGRPSMGSWVNYGLGSECDDLPGFVVLTSVGGRNPQPIASRQWAAGFLPSRYPGRRVQLQPAIRCTTSATPRASVERSSGAGRCVNGSTGMRNADRSRNPEIDTRIAAYEMAFRMQASVPGTDGHLDEPQHVLDLYGAKPGDGSFASNCLLARRLAERGVRFIQLYHRGWDHHGDLVKVHERLLRR
jgi:hypothetical protein